MKIIWYLVECESLRWADDDRSRIRFGVLDLDRLRWCDRCDLFSLLSFSLCSPARERDRDRDRSFLWLLWWRFFSSSSPPRWWWWSPLFSLLLRSFSFFSFLSDLDELLSFFDEDPDMSTSLSLYLKIRKQKEIKNGLEILFWISQTIDCLRSIFWESRFYLYIWRRW